MTGIWTGGDDKWIRFLTLNDGQGFVMARPIFEKYMRKLEADTTAVYNAEAEFALPPAGFYSLIDCDKYKTLDPEEEQNQIRQDKTQRDEFEEEFDEEFEEDEEMEEEF